MNKSSAILLSLLALAAGAGGGYFTASQSVLRKADQPTATMDAEKRRPLFYRNPMNPEVTSPVPAKDEMGMEYIAVYADGGAHADKDPSGTVSIDPVTVQNIGVRTARVKVIDLSRAIRAVGRVTYDEERVTRLHPKVEGWVDKLYVDKTGQPVEKNTILLGIYSPQLVATEQEYLLALSNRKTLQHSTFADIRKGADDLVQSAHERLQLLDVPAHQIRDLERTQKIMKSLHIHSPFKGMVINLGVREGQYVTPQTELYMLADLSRIWVYADLYEDDLPWVKMGDTAVMEVSGIPGKRYTGTVSYIYPFLESATRTTRVRLEFDNRDLDLKPEMFANVTIDANPQRGAMVVPSEAIVRSGTRNEVFLTRGDGKFEPRVVTIGVTSHGLTQILAGVKPDDEVVTSSQFLIDSESNLREATEKMREAAQQAAPMADPGVGTETREPGARINAPPANAGTVAEKPL